MSEKYSIRAIIKGKIHIIKDVGDPTTVFPDSCFKEELVYFVKSNLKDIIQHPDEIEKIQYKQGRRTLLDFEYNYKENEYWIKAQINGQIHKLKVGDDLLSGEPPVLHNILIRRYFMENYQKNPYLPDYIEMLQYMKGRNTLLTFYYKYG